MTVAPAVRSCGISSTVRAMQTQQTDIIVEALCNIYFARNSWHCQHKQNANSVRWAKQLSTHCTQHTDNADRQTCVCARQCAHTTCMTRTHSAPRCPVAPVALCWPIPCHCIPKSICRRCSHCSAATNLGLPGCAKGVIHPCDCPVHHLQECHHR
jgi:hypothetical protein